MSQIQCILFGAGIILQGGIILVLSIFVGKKIAPELSIDWRLFDYNALKEMVVLGAGVLVNQFGALLFMNSDLIIINIILGSAATGKYAPIVQWAILMRTLAGVITRSFGPVVMELLAKNEYEALIRYFNRIVKMLCLILGLPACVICGLSKPLISVWIGDEYADLYKLMILLVLGQLLPYSLGTIFAIFKGMDKLKLPSIITICAGVGNVLLSIILIKTTPLAIYGAGVATIVAVLSKNVFFNIYYLGKILNYNPISTWKSIFSSIVPVVILSFLAFWLLSFVEIDDYVSLLSYGIIIGTCYFIIVYFLIFNVDDKKLFLKVTKIDKVMK